MTRAAHPQRWADCATRGRRMLTETSSRRFHASETSREVHVSNRFPTRLNVDDFSTVNRRQLLRGLGASALVTAAGGLFARSVWGSPVFAAYPFALGVASGDPAPDGFVIWTKIAPKPLERGGGMPRKPGRGRMVGGDRRAHAPGRAARARRRASRTRPCGACRGRRAGAGARLFLSVHDRRRAQPRGTCADAAAGGSVGGAASLRRRRLPALRGRLLHRVSAASPPSGSISSSTTATTSTNIAWCVLASGHLPVVRVMPGEPDESTRSTTTGIATASTDRSRPAGGARLRSRSS